MGSGGGWTWQPGSLGTGLKTLPTKMDLAVRGTMEFFAPEVENHAKVNAPWTDRTANARNGLAAQSFTTVGGSHGIVLYHQVPYGIWLEVKRSGEYAIIMPTIRHMGPVVMAGLVKLLEAIR